MDCSTDTQKDGSYDVLVALVYRGRGSEIVVLIDDFDAQTGNLVNPKPV